MPDTLCPWLLLTLLHIIRVSKVQSFASNLIVFISYYAPLPPPQKKSSKSNQAYSISMHRQLHVSITWIYFSVSFNAIEYTKPINIFLERLKLHVGVNIVLRD